MLSDEKRSEISLTNIDSSDCGVIAIQAVTGLSRERAERLAKDAGGYRPGQGTPYGGVDRAVREAGHRVVTFRTDLTGETPATFSLMHEAGVYLLYVEGHVMALVNGDLHNARGSWGKPLMRVVEVI